MNSKHHVGIGMTSQRTRDRLITRLEEKGISPNRLECAGYGNKVMLGLLNIEGLEVWAAVSIFRRARQLFWIGISLMLILVTKIQMPVKSREYGTNKRKTLSGKKIKRIWEPKKKRERRHI